MSKEQTPMEFIESKGLEDRNLLNADGRFVAVSYLMEQYAQAKVLEALEREVIEAYCNGGVTDEIYFSDNDNLLKEDAISYYETEVKPKYEK